MSVPTFDPTIEQVAEWCRGLRYTEEDLSYERMIAMQAAEWGADQELEACCEWLEDTNCDDSQEAARLLRAARRPKPPSEKEQTLLDLDWIQDNQSTTAYDDRFDRIRRALEQLND